MMKYNLFMIKSPPDCIICYLLFSYIVSGITFLFYCSYCSSGNEEFKHNEYVSFDPSSIDICLSVAAVPVKRNFWILKVAAQKRDVNWLTDGRRRRKIVGKRGVSSRAGLFAQAIVLTHIKRIENIDPQMFDVLHTAFVQGVTKRSLRRPPIPPFALYLLKIELSKSFKD